MAFLGLRVPQETARILAEVDIGKWGEKEPPSSFHITMAYMGREVPIETIAQMIPAIFPVVAKTSPFTVSTSHVTTFPPHPEDGVPIIARVDSEPLHAFRAAVCQAMDAAGVDFSKKFPDYKPHVTLAYAKDALVHYDNAFDIHIPTIEWAAHELVLWGGDNGDNRLIVTFPLSIAMSKTAMHRAYVQLAKNWSTDPVSV